MNATPASAPRSPPAGLHARRCARHVAREAAARCPDCGDFFCRECVVEHSGRLLCAPCLARLAGKGGKRHPQTAGAWRVAALAAGGLVLWGAFYGLGALLLKIPPAFHDGTIWKNLTRQ